MAQLAEQNRKLVELAGRLEAENQSLKAGKAGKAGYSKEGPPPDGIGGLGPCLDCQSPCQYAGTPGPDNTLEVHDCGPSRPVDIDHSFGSHLPDTVHLPVSESETGDLNLTGPATEFCSHHACRHDGMVIGGGSNGSGFSICWQVGPTIDDSGQQFQNGAIVDTVIGACIDRLAAYQRSPMACSETALAIHRLRSALEHLQHRRSKRQVRGVLGTLQQ